MAVIGKGQVVIEGKDKTAKAFNSAQSRVTRLSGSVKAMGASLIAAFGIRQVTRYGAELLKVHDATNKMAKATGLSAETIEEFRHALQLSGLSATQADSGLRTFVKRVGELKTEQGAAYTALKKFDEGLLAALQTAGSTEEAMQIAAKAIQSIDDPMQKAAISSALFSKKVGVDLTAALQGGEQGLWDLMKASREAIGEGLGAESRAKIERFNDEITNAKAAFQNVASHILVELLPALLSFSGWLTGTALPAVKDFIATIKDWWAASEDVRKVVGVTLVTALNLVMGVIGAVGNIVVTVTDEFNAWATGAKDAGEAIKSVIKRVKNEINFLWSHVKRTMARFNKALGDPWSVLSEKAKEAKEAVIKIFKQLVTDTKAMFEKMKKAIVQKWDDLIQGIKDKAKGIKDALNPFKLFNKDVTAEFSDTADNVAKSMFDMREEVNEIGEGIVNDATGACWAKDFRKEVSWEFEDAKANAVKSMGKMRTDVNDTGEKMVEDAGRWGPKFRNQIAGLFDDLASGFSDGVGNLFKDIMNGNKDAFKKFGTAIKDTIVNAIGDAIGAAVKDKLTGVFKDVIANIFKGGGSGLGSLLGGGGAGGGGGGIGSIISKLLGGLGGGGGTAISLGTSLHGGAAAAAGGGSGIASIGAKIISTLKGGFAGLTGGLGSIAGFAAPLGLAAFGFAQISKRRKLDKAEFAALMADNTVRANMFLGEMTSGFKTIKQEGGQAWLQVSEGLNDYMGQLDEAGSSKSKGHFLWHELVRVRDEFGNVIVRARDVDKLWNQINNSAPFLNAIENSAAVASNMEKMKMNGEGVLIEGNAISEALSLIAKGAGDTEAAMRAMSDGTITAAESIALGLGEAAVGTSEKFRILTQDALVVENGWKKMGQTGVDALLAIDQESVAFRTAMEDNLLDQVEAVQFGLGYMGDIGRAEFESMVEWSMRASDSSAALGAVTKVLGDEFVQLGSKAVQSLINIDMAADPVQAALADGIVTAAEAAALGFEALGERSAEQFAKIVAAAKGATSHMGELRNAADNAAAAAARAAMTGNSHNGNGPRMDTFATGGQFTVGGRGGVDTNVVAFKATKGERVTVETPQQQKTSDGTEGTQALLSEIANSVRQADANNTRALERQRWAEAASNRH